MICEKCQKEPAKVHFRWSKDDSQEPQDKATEQHLCEECARDYIQSDPQLKRGQWSKPTKRFVLDVGQLPR